MRDIRDYDDIIGLPHFRSKVRKPMTAMARAAQFAPFAALNGYGELMDETGSDFEDRAQSDVEKAPVEGL